jgi:hypothetical protein
VTTCGRICFNRQNINLSVVFAGQSVGIRQVSGRRSARHWLAEAAVSEPNTSRAHELSRRDLVTVLGH